MLGNDAWILTHAKEGFFDEGEARKTAVLEALARRLHHIDNVCDCCLIDKHAELGDFPTTQLRESDNLDDAAIQYLFDNIGTNLPTIYLHWFVV